MNEPVEYGRYRGDERVLALIGRWHREAATGSDLPSDLADAALAAWLREEDEWPETQETDEQRRVRAAAATLALIGLEVQKARDQGRPPSIHADTIAEAVAAADSG